MFQNRVSPRFTPPRLIGVVLVVAGVAYGIVGCTDDNATSEKPGPTIDQIKDATFAEQSAAYVGETQFADGTSGVVEGVSQAEPPAGEVTHPIQTATGLQDLTFLWVDDTIYVQRAVTTDSSAISSTIRLDTDPPWSQAGYQPLTTLLFDAYDPFRLLERLSALSVAADPQGTETVGDEDLERYAVDMTAVTVAPAGARTIDLLTDGDKRLRVVRLVGDETVEYTLTEFGVEVSPVPPPEDQVGSSAARPAVQPVGPYATVAQGGTSTGGSWQLFRAPGTDGGSCWRVESDPPLDPVAATGDAGETCIGAFDPTAGADEQVKVVVDSGADAPFDLVVAAVSPGSTNAEIQLADGRSLPLAIDPLGFVVWVGPEAPLAVVLEVTAPDGNVAVCGPGPVTSLDDLEVMSPDQLATLDRMPWLCLEL